MKKVITYGTFDLLHVGHENLLRNAKALGDYLIVGITAEDFDRKRGKINTQQSLMERIEAVRATRLADEIIIEEYEGQKIDDIQRYGVDIFTVGSDWKGKFDYLNKYCKVVYLDRTQGISSSEIRSKQTIRVGFVGNVSWITKFIKGASYVNGLTVAGICTEDVKAFSKETQKLIIHKPYVDFLDEVDAVYIASSVDKRVEQVKLAIEKGKHVLCESPIALSKDDCGMLFDLAKKRGCVLMESIKTAYSVAYCRLLLLAQSGQIGKIVSIDDTCTSLLDESKYDKIDKEIKSFHEWGPFGLLPVLQLLGTDYVSKDIIVKYINESKKIDAFTNVRFVFKDAVANIKIGKGVKSEGELIVTGTKGYIYVPAPWWKTEYFEIRYENGNDNKRFFFQLEDEGIRYEFVSFIKNIETGSTFSYVSREVSEKIAEIMDDFENGKDVIKI